MTPILSLLFVVAENSTVGAARLVCPVPQDLVLVRSPTPNQPMEFPEATYNTRILGESLAVADQFSSGILLLACNSKRRVSITDYM